MRVIKSSEMETWDEDTSNFRENVERALVGRTIAKVEVEVTDRDLKIILDNGVKLRFSSTWIEWDEYSGVESSLVMDLEVPEKETQDGE